MKQIKKTNQILILLIIINFGCKSNKSAKPIKCTNDIEIKMGSVKVELPECYQVYFPDTVNHPSQGYLVKGDSIKLEIGIGGFTNSRYIDKNTAIINDTISGKYLRQISSFKKGENYYFGTLILDFESDLRPLFDSSYSILLSAFVPDYVTINETEGEIFLKAFQNSKIIETP